MKSSTIDAIIIGHRNLGEFDKVIFLYSKEFGKIEVIAKGARRITSKFTGHLESLNVVTASLYFGPRNTILTEIFTKNNFGIIRNNLSKLQSALQIIEITNQTLYPEQVIENLSTLIEETIQKITTSERCELLGYSYIIKLLDMMGVIPNFKELESKIEEKYLKFLQFIKDRSFNEIEKIKLSPKEEIQIRDIIKDLIEDYTGRNFSSLAL